MKSALNLFSVLRFKDVIEINYPNINILAVLPYNGKEEIIIKKIYKTIKDLLIKHLRNLCATSSSPHPLKD